MDSGVRKTKMKTSDYGDRFIQCVVLWILGKLWEISSEMCLCLASVILCCNRVHDSPIECFVEAHLLFSKFIAVRN